MEKSDGRVIEGVKDFLVFMCLASEKQRLRDTEIPCNGGCVNVSPREAPFQRSHRQPALDEITQTQTQIYSNSATEAP